MKHCTSKKCKWIIIAATIGLLVACFVMSKLMAAPHGGGGHSGGGSHVGHSGGGRGYGRGGYWGGGVGVDVGPYYDDYPYYDEPVVDVGVEPVVGVGIGGGWGGGYGYGHGYGHGGRHR
jgi:hypothetical protein